MENKQLVLLKVVVSKHDNHRLKLIEKDYKSLVEGKKFNLLTIEFDDTSVIDFTKSSLIYLNDGELAQKGRISLWIERNGFHQNSETVLLLFELAINEKESSHHYRYLGNACELYNQISDIINK